MCVFNKSQFEINRLKSLELSAISGKVPAKKAEIPSREFSKRNVSRNRIEMYVKIRVIYSQVFWHEIAIYTQS